MDSTDLIFTPFKITCPKCESRVEISFEELQFNDEITCPYCKNVFTPNSDAERLLALVKATEKHLSDISSTKENET